VGRQLASASPPALTLILPRPVQVYEEVTGSKHAGAKEMEQGGAGMSVLTKEALVKGTFAGAGVKSEREALTGENMQQLELIRREVAGQDAILDEMSTKLDELKDVAERIGDVSGHMFPAERRGF